MKHRLDDQIRALCQKLIDAKETGEYESAANELRSALHEHIARLRASLLFPISEERRSKIDD